MTIFFDKKKEEEDRAIDQLKATAVLNEAQANQIMERIASLLSSNFTITPLSQYFPMWFCEEATNDDELTAYKAKMENYAFWHNERQVKKNGWNDTSGTESHY